MPKFSATSKARLATCHPDLQRLFNKVIETYDCSILDGRRGKEEQNKAFDEGRSKVQYPNSNHNQTPSLAVDVAPYPVIWPDEEKRPKEYVKDMARFYHFMGYVKAKADEMGIKIRCGGDWDGDFNFKDQNFDDLPHFELDRRI